MSASWSWNFIRKFYSYFVRGKEKFSDLWNSTRETFHCLIIKACVDYCTALCNQKESCKPRQLSISIERHEFMVVHFFSSFLFFFFRFLSAHLFSVTRFLRILHDKTISSHSFLSPVSFSSFTFAYVPLFSHSKANEI